MLQVAISHQQAFIETITHNSVDSRKKLEDLSNVEKAIQRRIEILQAQEVEVGTLLGGESHMSVDLTFDRILEEIDN